MEFFSFFFLLNSTSSGQQTGPCFRWHVSGTNVSRLANGSASIVPPRWTRRGGRGAWWATAVRLPSLTQRRQPTLPRKTERRNKPRARKAKGEKKKKEKKKRTSVGTTASSPGATQSRVCDRRGGWTVGRWADGRAGGKRCPSCKPGVGPGGRC